MNVQISLHNGGNSICVGVLAIDSDYETIASVGNECIRDLVQMASESTLPEGYQWTGDEVFEVIGDKDSSPFATKPIRDVAREWAETEFECRIDQGGKRCEWTKGTWCGPSMTDEDERLLDQYAAERWEELWDARDSRISLVDFWNTRDVSRLFATSTYVPVGVTYESNVDTDGDDYCDLGDLLESGLSTESLFHLNGSVNGDRWIWDGQCDVRDYHGNSYLRIECW